MLDVLTAENQQLRSNGDLPAGQALSPLSPEGKGDLGESGGAPSLTVKKGTGDDFRIASLSRRGRVR